MAGIKIHIGMPLRGNHCHFAAGIAHLVTPSRNKDVQVIPTFAVASLLPLSFNLLWTQALAARQLDGTTHFAMLHDDVLPAAGWLDVLLHELEWLEADIVSAVVPIKDHQGLTSTALETGDVWNPRRLTMKEIFDRQETFTHDGILLNTGCWVCDLRKPWCDKVWFKQQDRVVKKDDGTYSAETISEDWDFSRQVRALGGIRLYATRKVQLDHDRSEFTNRYVWGTCETDPNHVPKDGGKDADSYKLNPVTTRA
jgi:hypothetical protein